MLNRMTSFTSSGTSSYAYRADGMRVSKSNSPGSTSYRYDGQMGMEDIDFASNGSVSKVTDYGIGARGIDAMFVTQSGATSVSYPLYDAHGNMISALIKQGVGGFAYSALRTFDAWGVIRRGAQSGDPKGRYCASLGHKQDDETGLVYIRARFYEPTTGRFVCEDPSRIGANFYIYCPADPVNRLDTTGQSSLAVNLLLLAVLAELAGAFLGIQVLGHILAVAGITWESIDYLETGLRDASKQAIIDFQDELILEFEAKALDSPEGIAAQNSMAGEAVDVCATEVGRVIGELIWQSLDACY